MPGSFNRNTISFCSPAEKETDDCNGITPKLSNVKALAAKAEDNNKHRKNKRHIAT